MATSRQIRISITSALNAAGIEATKAQVAAMSKSVEKSLGGMSQSSRRHMADIKAGFDMAIGAVKTFAHVVATILKSAFRFETQTMQFKTLVGDIDEAKRHMQDLKALGDTPPFSLDEFAKASRAMMVMTDGALGYRQALQLVGDAAAATGHPIEEMGQMVGRLYAFIRDGEPLSRATMQLRNMGVLTPEVTQKLQDMQNAGRSNAEIWAEVEKALSRYNGAMAETEKTGDGLMGAIQSRWDSIIRSVGEAFSDTAKGGMQDVLDKAKELEESGAIEVWVRDSLDWLKEFAEGAKVVIEPVGKVFGTLWKTIKGGWGVVGQSAGNYFGTLIGGGNPLDALSAGIQGAKQGWIDAFDLDNAEAEHHQSKLDEIAKKHAAERAEMERRETERVLTEKQRIIDALAEGQRKKEEREALAIVRKKAEEERRLAEQRRREEEREAERIAREQERAALKAANAHGETTAEPPPGDPHFSGRGDIPTDAYAENEAQIADLMARRQALTREKFREYQSRWNERWSGSAIDRNGMLPTDPWNSAVAAAREHFATRLDALQERREQLEHGFAHGLGGASDPAERTANACEGILRHFEEGRM